MKKKEYKTRKERLDLVLDIVKKLRAFPMNDYHGTIDIYSAAFPAIAEVKQIFRNYIGQDDVNPCGYSGKIAFPELNKTIEYILPISKHAQSLFVFRAYQSLK